MKKEKSKEEFAGTNVLGTDIDRSFYFHVALVAENSNPNGDPMDEGRPRTTPDGLGLITNVCAARKIRDAAAKSGEKILLQSDDKRTDSFSSVQARLDGTGVSLKLPRHELRRALSEAFFDVRLRGVTLALPSKKGEGDRGTSIGIRQAMSLTDAISVEPVKIVGTQITRSHNMAEAGDSEKGSETMGMRYVVERGVYVFFGCVSPFAASLSGMKMRDVEVLKNILPFMLCDDYSQSRPCGSFYVRDILWREVPANARVNPARIFKSALANQVSGELEIVDEISSLPAPERIISW